MTREGSGVLQMAETKKEQRELALMQEAAKRQKRRTIRKNNLFFLGLAAPGIIALLMFSYFPMAGLYMVFTKYTYQGGIFGSEFVGLQNFRFFFMNMDAALRATRNTLVINLVSMLLGTCFNVGLAIILNELSNKLYKSVTQSIMLFPHFVSWIVVGVIAQGILDTDKGLLNQLITACGGEAINWYMEPKYWWFILIFSNIWKGMGYGSIVYSCAITGLDPSLYEAAKVDGASRWKQIFYITIPQLKPTIVIMLLLSMGGVLGGSVDQIMGLTNLNPMLLETTDTIATFVYRSAIMNGQFESASAITLYQSIFGFLFVMIGNFIVKKIQPDYALF